MPDPQFTLLAATGADHATDTLRLVAASTHGTVAGIEAATRDIAAMPLLQHLSDVMPAADLMLGSVMLIVVMLMHAVILPDGWKMLAPIIAMSGLFTFGWTGSVLVDLVGRCQKIKDAAAAGGQH